MLFYQIADPFKTQLLLQDFAECCLCRCATACLELDPATNLFVVGDAEEFKNYDHKISNDIDAASTETEAELDFNDSTTEAKESEGNEPG